MNVTAALLALVITLGYYFHTVRKERINFKKKSATGGQEQEDSDNLLHMERGDM